MNLDQIAYALAMELGVDNQPEAVSKLKDQIVLTRAQLLRQDATRRLLPDDSCYQTIPVTLDTDGTGFKSARLPQLLYLQGAPTIKRFYGGGKSASEQSKESAPLLVYNRYNINHFWFYLLEGAIYTNARPVNPMKLEALFDDPREVSSYTSVPFADRQPFPASYELINRIMQTVRTTVAPLPKPEDSAKNG